MLDSNLFTPSMTADNTAICEIAGGPRSASAKARRLNDRPPLLQWPFSTFCAKPRLACHSKHFRPSAYALGYFLTPLRGLLELQKISFSANWICREVVAVFVMTPPEEL